jgi:hypothetical protein
VVTLEKKKCARCKRHKGRPAFNKNLRYTDGLQSYCRACTAQYRQDNREKIDAQIQAAKKANPDKYKDQWLRKLYGISLERYRKMDADQGGVCAICRRPPGALRKGQVLALSVDHDHSCCPGKRSCGKCVRSLLCSRCNFGIGQFNDDPNLLLLAVNYLEGFNTHD